jgi:uncharacterized membrane protein YbaN (DUF454 family)
MAQQLKMTAVTALTVNIVVTTSIVAVLQVRTQLLAVVIRCCEHFVKTRST